MIIWALLPARTRAVLVALAVCIGLAIAVPARTAFASDWTGFGLDATRSRATTEIIGSRFIPAWLSEVPSAKADAVYRTLLASPAVADGFIAVASYGNTVRVLRESDGVALWETQLGDAMIASPVIDRGWLYVPCLDRNLYALRLSDGRLAWKTNLGGITYSSPVVSAGSVVVAAGAPTPRVLRLNAETGAILWSAGADILQQSLDSSVVIAAGHVIVGEANGRFHSFAFADGQHQWRHDIGGTAGLASPVVLGDRVYLPTGGADGRVAAVDLATGAPVAGWPVDITSSIPIGGTTGTVLLARSVTLSSLGTADGLILVDARADDNVDTNANGAVDLFRMREGVIALDAVSGRVAWTAPNGARDAADPNQIPTHGLLPTPGVHRALDGAGMAVVASTLLARVAVLDLRTGTSRASLVLPSATRASPASANGRLILATDSGAIVALGSLDNASPATPVGMLPATGAASDASATVVTWPSVRDVDGDAVTYQIRWDTDGEILHNAAGEGVTSAGVTTWRLPPLAPDSQVVYAVRARDARGAWSDWSTPQTFTTVITPPVSIDGHQVAGIAAAIGIARPGQTIHLGMGRYPLGETMRVPGGVAVKGAGPHLTVIDGRGLGTAVTFSSSNAEQPSTLRDLTVRGASTGVATGQGAHVVLQNVIVSDNTAFGIDVGASGVATAISTTLYRNDVAARSFGRMNIRNSIITANRRGLVATPADALVSRYNDLFANREVAYENVLTGKGDLTRDVVFHQAEAGDLRLVNESATTDQGDPADDFSREPAPNGSRINLGAFGGTAFAELSPVLPSSTVGSTPGAGASPVGSPSAPSTMIDPPDHPKSSGGCALTPLSPSDSDVNLGLNGLLGTLGLALGLVSRYRRRHRR